MTISRKLTFASEIINKINILQMCGKTIVGTEQPTIVAPMESKN